ncbi:MAG: hypothetical protein L6R19_01800 [Alphaproteobacteria bacterium]|nr:hypothetical protein [Alphaproteobacteria bacterium]
MSAGRARAAARLAVTLATIAVGPAAAQTYQDRSQAVARCYRDAQRSAGTPPRDNPRPGDDLVAMERRRRDYEDRFRTQLDRCLYEADRRLRGKKP